MQITRTPAPKSAVQLEIEPGRFLVAESGFVISEIRSIKTAG